MDSFLSFFRALDWSVPLQLVLNVIPALLCITLHELCHGLAALALGDTTARDAGRLSLNPLRHVDVMGLIMMVAFKFGWAKPVPVNMYRFRHPKRGMAITALAGPVSNLLLCVLVLFLYGLLAPVFLRWGTAGERLMELFVTTAYLSLSLAVFNVLPVPPLDGSKVLYALLPERAYFQLMRYEKYGMLLLLVLVWSGILGTPLSNITQDLFARLTAAADWGFSISRGLL